jgi:hypothetical protein
MTDRPEDDGVSDYEIHRLYENVTEQDADVVLRLETRISALTTERDQAVTEANNALRAMHRSDEEVDRLRAERDRLREEREALLSWCDLNPEWYARAVAEMLRDGSFSASPPEQERALGISARFWTNLETLYREALAALTASRAELEQARAERDKLKRAVVAFSDMGLAHRDWTEHVGAHDGATDQEMHGFDRCTNCGKVNVHWPDCAINVNARHGCTCVAPDGSRAALSPPPPEQPGDDE